MKKIFLILISFVFLAGCEPKIDEFEPSQGSADFSRFIVFGHSMPSGYADGALYNSGQLNSTGNILHTQLAFAGSGEFVQPMVTSEYGVLPGKRMLGPSTDCRGITSLGVVADQGPLDPLAPLGYAVHNLAVPGMKSFHAFAPHYGDFLALPNANPYYCRFATNPANRVVDEIAPLNPTFFLLWLGENDLLYYAVSGGSADSITSPQLFGQTMGGIMQALTANGAKGVVATVGDVTKSPFFTTIPYNGLVLTQSQADSINFAMTLYQLPFTNYKAGPNPFLVTDPSSPHPYFKVRQMQPGELVLLTVPQDSMKCAGMGIINPNTFMPYPIPDNFVLKMEEVTALQNATTAYNAIIEQLAGQFGLAVVDINTHFQTLEAGIVWDGIKLSTKFITGGAFSTDGLHLNPRGNAVTTNYIIDAINAKYGSNIPKADITAYPGLIFP